LLPLPFHKSWCGSRSCMVRERWSKSKELFKHWPN